MTCILDPRKLLLLTILLFQSNSFAVNRWDIDQDQNIEYSGYVGYRYLFSDNEIKSTYSGRGLPEIGLNLTYNNNNFQIFNQFRYGENSGTYLVYNFMQYTFNIMDDVNLSVRGGKLRHDLALYNTTRVNPKTRQGIIMPQGVYWDVFNEFLTSGVGVGMSLQYKEIELSYTIDDPTVIDSHKTARVFYGPMLHDTHTSFGSHQVAALTYSPKNLPLLIKASWAGINFGNETGPAMPIVGPQFVNKDVTAEIISFGAEYKLSDWVFAGETVWFKTVDKEWTEDTGDISKGYSLSTTYQINENVDVRFNYNEFNSKLAKSFFPETPWVGYRRDLNIGLNYHTGPWMFQVEGHHINGARTMDSVDVKDIGAYKEWWMMGIQAVYSF